MARRILVSAYGCEPDKGSEQGVGWHWVLELAGLAELVVITRKNNREAIEGAFPEDLSGRVRFQYVDLPGPIRRLKRGARGLYPYYLLWQWWAYRHARRLLRTQHFDYAMHLTFGSVWMPTFMHRLPVPFVWGPVGGAEAVPFRLIATLPRRARLIQYLRHALVASFALNPLYWGVVRRAQVILARTPDTARMVPRRYADKVRVVLETAMAESWLTGMERPDQLEAVRPLRLVYSGRLVAFKNLRMALDGLARANDGGVDARLLVLGDGPLHGELVGRAQSLGMIDRVEFRGNVSQLALRAALAGSDAYLFPSLREGGVWSLMEAMATGLPAICVRTSGMAVIADDHSAIMVDPGEPEQMVDDFAAAIITLARSPDLRQTLGRAARERIATKFCWHQKGEFMADVFQELENMRP